MAIPRTEAELDQLMQSMDAMGAPASDKKDIIDAFIKQQEAPVTKQPGGFERFQEFTQEAGPEVLKSMVTQPVQVVKGAVEGFKKGREKTKKRTEFIKRQQEEEGTSPKLIARKILNPFQAIFDVQVESLAGVAEGAAAPVTAAAEIAFEELPGEATKEKIAEAVQTFSDWYENLPEEQRVDLETASTIAKGLGLLLEVPAVQGLQKVATRGADIATDVVQRTGIDDAARRVVQDLSAKASKTAEDILPTKPTVQEKMLAIDLEQGDIIKQLTQELPKVDPAIRRQLRGKQDLLEDYIKRTVASNADINAPSPLSFASERATTAMKQIEEQIADTGSQIGQFREKIATIKAQPAQIQGAIDTLEKQASNFGLKVDKGSFVADKSRVTKLSPAEINKLNAMRKDLIDLKGDPKSLRLIDLRSKIDSDIKFAKDRQDISDNLDGLARAVRTDLAEINRSIIGAEQAGLLEEFSQLNDLLFDFRKLSSKGKNQEFFIKRVLSERDRLPKEAMARIEEVTGINLLDDATAVDLVTDYVGSDRTKGLFEQEIAKAGVDVAAGLLTRGPVATSLDVIQRGMKKLFPDQAERIDRLVRSIANNENALVELEEILSAENAL